MGRDEALEVVAGGLCSPLSRTSSGSRWLARRAGGAMDVPAARLANRLVGNPESMAVLEVTGQGPTIRLRRRPRVLAVAGADLSATLDDPADLPGRGVLWRPGEVLSFADPRRPPRLRGAGRRGRRAACARVARHRPAVRARGFQGRALRRRGPAPASSSRAGLPGRTVRPPWAPAGSARARAPLPGATRRRVHRRRPRRPVCRTLGHRAADRTDGVSPARRARPLVHRAAADITSIGLPIGAIQVPADGVPIVLLADHQPTGGYAVPATVRRQESAAARAAWPGDRGALCAHDRRPGAGVARRPAPRSGPGRGRGRATRTLGVSAAPRGGQRFRRDPAHQPRVVGDESVVVQFQDGSEPRLARQSDMPGPSPAAYCWTNGVTARSGRETHATSTSIAAPPPPRCRSCRRIGIALVSGEYARSQSKASASPPSGPTRVGAAPHHRRPR